MRSSDESHDADLHTWRPCPVPNSNALVALVLVLLYAAFFIFATQYSRFLMYIMTGMVGVMMVLLYTSGIICVIYMLFNGYPTPEPMPTELKAAKSHKIRPKSPDSSSVVEMKF